jgi:hypothetical protein
MNRRTALALGCSGLLSVAAFAGDEAKAEQKPPACCAKKDAKAAAEKGGKLRCSLTGREVDKCCCEPREGGKMRCTLAKKDVDKCCCTDVKAEGKETR